MAKLTPVYSKELSIYEQETLRDIEIFRAARKNWLLTNSDKNTPTTEKENLKQSNVCNANFRLPYLRRLKPPVTSCSVFKTLRPIRYYTLKPRTSDPDDGEKRRSRKRRVRQYELVAPTVVDAPEEEVAKTSCKEKAENRKSTGPCQEAINRLKAAHLQQELIESCRCDDGREVTVVIKGICLCDKNSLNKIKLNKVCEKFWKLGIPPEDLMRKPQGEEETEKDIGEPSGDKSKTSIEKLLEEKLPGMEDYTEFSSKNVSTSIKTDENSEVTVASEGKTPKKVDFTDEDIKRKMRPRKFLNLNGSDLTVYRKLPVSEEALEDSSSEPAKEAESLKQSEPVKELNEKGDVSNWSTKSLNFKKGDTRNPKKSSGVSDLTEPLNKPRTMEDKSNLMDPSEEILPHSSEKQKTHSLLKVESDGVSASRVTVVDEKNKKKNLSHPQPKSASTISLFKNYHQDPSTLGLTKEQMEVLKGNENKTTTKAN